MERTRKREGNPVQIVIGGQYGSEAKGTIAAYLAIEDAINIAVRTGAVNAGHTVIYGGLAYAMQQLPVAWVNPDTQLIIGAGALVDPAILEREIAMVSAATGTDVRSRLMIDYRAYIHRPVHTEGSKVSDRHHLMGATGKGCSEALVDRIRLRGREDWTVGTYAKSVSDSVFGDILIADTEAYLNDAWDQGARIQLEGTQGQLLDLYLGPYPYTTHKQTGPAQWMLEAGLSPSLPTDIVMVVRTFPIRVAGNSGPLPQEVAWPDLARMINTTRTERGLAPIVRDEVIAMFEDAVRVVARDKYHDALPPGSDGLDMHEWGDGERRKYRVAASELHADAMKTLDPTVLIELKQLFEFTTVTKKLRRIALCDRDDLTRSARQVRPDRVAVTFMNYQFPHKWATRETLSPYERGWLDVNIVQPCHAPVTLINRGPLPDHIVKVDVE